MRHFLPKLFRWGFTVCAVLAAFAAGIVLVLMLVDPELPAGAHFGPIKGEFLGQPASIAVQAGDAGAVGQAALRAQVFNGNITMTVDEAGGAIERLKRYGLPVLLLYAVFLTALFEVLRRLFRNVERGESFTPQSVRLVQIVGGSLLVFSLLCAIGESWFAHAMYAYLVDHTQIVISGTPVSLPPAESPPWLGYHSPFGRPTFFYGLLVLALAEVFRQGLALQRDSDLTV